jgi:hypothetical protein
LMYFIRQPKLRKTIHRELVDWIEPFRNETWIFYKTTLI